jgi:hypothetical protein
LPAELLIKSTRWWAKHFVRNHILVVVALAVYNLLLIYLWTNYGLALKRLPLGSVVTSVIALYIMFSWIVPLRHAEEYPDQLLKAERWLLSLFVITFVAYSLSAYFARQSDIIFAAFGSTWIMFFFPYFMILRSYFPRALARMRLLESESRVGQSTPLDRSSIIKRDLRLFIEALTLYNRDLTGSYGFKLRDVERFSKPMLFQLLSQNEAQPHTRVDVANLISSMKKGPIESVRTLKAMAGEPVETNKDLYTDLEFEPGYVRVFLKYAPAACAVVGTIIGIVVNIHTLFG